MQSNEGLSVIALRADGMERDVQTAHRQRLTVSLMDQQSGDAPDTAGETLDERRAILRIFCRSSVEMFERDPHQN